MRISYDAESRVFRLETQNTTYQMQIGPVGHLLHLYYGRPVPEALDYRLLPRDCGFSPNPYDLREHRGWSLDTLPQEYSSADNGDFRCPSLELRTASGFRGSDLRYAGHEIRKGKYNLVGLPSAFDREDDCETLSITLKDEAAGVAVELLYGVFPNEDVIARAVKITNGGAEPLWLTRAASACLDLPFGSWELLHFHGRHCMERQPERRPLIHGVQTISSNRGASSHQHNPFVILCAPETTEDVGDCIGVMPVYSGGHFTDVELDQSGSVRLVTGLSDGGFSWKLDPGETFTTPEVLFIYTHEGLTHLSHTFHRFLRQNLCGSKFASAPRPVLVNSWEAAYFDFNADLILTFAEGAKELGAELLVLDDGWFGRRNHDKAGLGDWYVNEEKLPGGLEPLIRKVNDLGLQFGLWVEPEMVNEDSDLYRKHPDWALTVPGRKPAVSRDQLVLDLSRPEVADWIYETIAALLRNYNIQYVKWDMNRHLTDVFSRALPADRQGEVSHRWVLGLYSVLERLTTEFPDVLLEGCAGGGGRFDAGMLAYCPQIWCSDNTDAYSRIKIQYGTSFGYPASAVGAHVSASPNHQTGRRTPLGSRGAVAMAGMLGYELDPGKLSEEERAEIRQQIRDYRELEPLIRLGDHYRLGENAWMFVSEQRDRALVTVTVPTPEGNPRPLHLRLKGLDPERRYQIKRATYFGCELQPEPLEGSFSGAALQYGGLTLPQLYGNLPGVQFLLEQTEAL